MSGDDDIDLTVNEVLHNFGSALDNFPFRCPPLQGEVLSLHVAKIVHRLHERRRIGALSQPSDGTVPQRPSRCDKPWSPAAPGPRAPKEKQRCQQAQRNLAASFNDPNVDMQEYREARISRSMNRSTRATYCAAKSSRSPRANVDQTRPTRASR
jgi:hypothetical protein